MKLLKYTLVLFLFCSCSESEIKNEDYRPYFGEIDQADKEFVEKEIEKTNNE